MLNNQVFFPLKALLLTLLLTPFSTQSVFAEPSSVTSQALKDAWNSYYAALDEMRVKLESTPRYQDTPRHRAKAYHALMEMQAMAYNFIIAPRMAHPRIFTQIAWQTDIYTLGQNGPDFKYSNIFLDGKQTYRLSGNRGDVKLFLIQVFDGVFGEEDVKTTANYALADLDVAKDGSFEIILGGPKQEGNWIPLDPAIDYQYVFIRRALADWADNPGELKIERISPIPDGYYNADEFDEAAMAKRIRRAEGFIRYLTNDFTIALYDWYYNNAGKQKNKMSLIPQTITSEVGSPSSQYAMGLFELKDDEALLIEMDQVPEGAYWSFQLGDVWSRSLPFSERQTSLNMSQVKVDSDGKLRVVVSNRDPGIANWLDTVDRQEGTVVFRNYRTSTSPVPVSRKVKIDELAKLLPADTARVTPEEREKALAARRDGVIYHLHHGE